MDAPGIEDSASSAPVPAAAGSAAHVFVESLDAPLLSEPDLHHLTRVLRLRDGELVTASDGGGRWRRCRFLSGPGGAESAFPTLEPDGPVIDEPRRDPAVTVGFSLTKGSRPEWVVQKATEVGVDGLIPFTSARSVVRWREERAVTHVERLRRIAREAAMQSRRTRLPEISEVADFGSVLRREDVRSSGALAQYGGEPPSLRRALLLVGPEGGWDDQELTCGLPRVGLGPSVLRAETAAVVSAMVLCSLRSGIVLAAGGKG